jgi:putative ABC transport system permease protein
MWIFKLIIKNAARHKLRTLLTITGLAVAIIAYGLIQTATTSWNKSIDFLSPDRLVIRHAVSFILDLPLAYKEKIKTVPGVENLAYFNWFGGIYKNDPKNFFPSMAGGPADFFDLYPEMIISEEQKEAFRNNRRGAVAGQKLIDLHGWHIGDEIRLTSQIYPGQWDFKLVGIYRASQPSVDEVSFFFRWDYLNEKVEEYWTGWCDRVGWYIVKIAEPDNAPVISAAIDALFDNSSAETLTETEKEFTQGFISGIGTIVLALKAMSYLIIGIILLVLANTMAMSARERISEYALLKTLGYKSIHLLALIMGESLMIAIVGGTIGILLAFPITGTMGEFLAMFFTYFQLDPQTIILSVIFIVLVGILSAVFPVLKSVRTSIVDGLRNIG